MVKRNSKGREILFKKAFLRSYIPGNAKGLSTLAVLATPILIGIGIIEIIESIIDHTDLSILQLVFVAIGLIVIQLFTSRHS